MVRKIQESHRYAPIAYHGVVWLYERGSPGDWWGTSRGRESEVIEWAIECPWRRRSIGLNWTPMPVSARANPAPLDLS
jgi:hypothetical protein